jgi:membrane-associated phospholipid phosphatase
MRTLPAFIALIAAALTGCTDDSVTTPVASEEGPPLAAQQVTSSERWMLLTRAIMGRREAGSPLGSARSFSLVAVAGYNAATAAGTAKVSGKQPSEAAAVSAAAAAVLLALYPVEQPAIAEQWATDSVYLFTFASERDADFNAGTRLGQAAAAAVLARAATDRTTEPFTGTIPTGPQHWVNIPPAQPVAPLWGNAKRWLMTTGSQFRPAAPPAYGSAEFQTALAQVVSMTAARTPEQLVSAQFWQFASGPAGPMGYFTELAIPLVKASDMNERASARTFALLHMAMMDATIACWDAKYTWWYVRPFQADARVTTPVGRPNFPAYPSAHSCLSSAAGAVLSGIFPSSKASMDAKVAEAGVARIVAGLHFSFDVTAGQELGSKVGALALARTPGRNTAIPLN